MRISVVLAAICSGVIVVGCSDKDTPLQQREDKGVLVNVISVERASIRTQHTLPGTLEALHTVQLHSQETGRILTMPYYPGDVVKRGTELVKLDDSLIRAEAQKAAAALRKAELDLKRISQLIEHKLVAEDELVRAQTLVDQTRAEHESLATRLRHTILRAPFDGIISARLKEPGDVLAIHQHVMTIYDPSKLLIRLQLSEFYLATTQPKQPVQIRIDALGPKSFSGYISRIYPTVNPSSRQGTIEIRLDPIPPGARPGQLCRVTIATATPPLLTIPVHTIRHDTQGEYVFRIDEKNTARHTRIKLGKQTGNHVEIIDGLSAGDRIVSEGFLDLRDGKKINLAAPQAAPTNEAAADAAPTTRGSGRPQ